MSTREWIQGYFLMWTRESICSSLLNLKQSQTQTAIEPDEDDEDNNLDLDSLSYQGAGGESGEDGEDGIQNAPDYLFANEEVPSSDENGKDGDSDDDYEGEDTKNNAEEDTVLLFLVPSSKGITMKPLSPMALTGMLQCAPALLVLSCANAKRSRRMDVVGPRRRQRLKRLK